MRSLCIGIGHFGIECIQSLEENLLPPSLYKNLSSNIKFLTEISSSSQQVPSNPWALMRIVEEERVLPLGEVVDSASRLHWQNQITRCLHELLKITSSSPKLQVYCFLGGHEGLTDPKHLDFKNLESMLTAAIRSTDFFEEDFFMRDPRKRRVHLHFIMTAPELTSMKGREQASQKFLKNLAILDKRIQFQRTKGSFVARLWIHSSLGIAGDDLSAGCAGLARLLSYPEIQQHNRLASMYLPVGAGDITHLISFFFLGSLTIPIGSLYHYTHLRLLYDGMTVLKDRVTVKQDDDNITQHDIITKIKNCIEELKPPKSEFSDVLAGTKIEVKTFDKARDIRARYSPLYQEAVFPDQSEHHQNLADQYNIHEGEIVKKVIETIQKDIMNQFDIKDGLQKFTIMEQALKKSLLTCRDDYLMEKPSETLASSTEGLQELETATEELPSIESIHNNTLIVAAPLTMLFTLLGTSKFLAFPDASFLTPIPIPLWKSLLVWTGAILLAFVISYLLVSWSGIERRKELLAALENRHKFYNIFLESGEKKDIQNQLQRAYLIRKERIRRAAVHTLVDMLGRLKAIKSAIFTETHLYAQELKQLGVELRQDEHDITLMLSKNKKYNISLIDSKSIVGWITNNIMIQLNKEQWADELIYRGWPKEGFLHDIPIGDKEDRYNESYDMISPIHEQKILSALVEQRRIIQRIHSWLNSLQRAPKPPCKPLKENLEPQFVKQIWEGAEPFLLHANNESGLGNLLSKALLDSVSFPKPIPVYSYDDWIYALFIWESIPFENIQRNFR